MKYLLSQEEYDTLRLRKEDEIAEDRHIILNKHNETDECGFDRNGSHSTGHYVCTCGWEDSGRVERIHDPREDKSPPSKERIPRIVSMMYDLGMYTQAREVQRLGDAYYKEEK